MEFIYGTARRNGVTVENLKTVGAEHSNLEGYVQTVRQIGRATIEDRCRVLEKYHTEDQGGLAYDWYYIDSHYRVVDTATADLQDLKENMKAESAEADQMKTAVKLYVQKATDIADAEALAMPDMFRTWEEVLEAGEALEANTVLRIGRQLYRVVQQVTPQAHQRPDGEGMLAVYRPIDQSHAGTLEDPIPFVYGMDAEGGKYYSYGGKIYLCNADMTPCVWPPDSPGLWQWEEAHAAG